MDLDLIKSAFKHGPDAGDDAERVGAAAGHHYMCFVSALAAASSTSNDRMAAQGLRAHCYECGAQRCGSVVLAGLPFASTCACQKF